MKAFFFGSSARPLFGVYEPPSGDELPRGVVICHAAGREYYDAHRECRALARRMSRSGLHVLRFDYLGTGDSGGEMDGLRPSDWVANVGQAVDELKDMTGLRRVTVVGLRAGAMIAARAIASRRDIEGFVAWDPVRPGVEGLNDKTLPAQFWSESETWEITPVGATSAPKLVVAPGPERAGAIGESREDGAPLPNSEVRSGAGPLNAADRDALGSGRLPTTSMDAIVDWVRSAR